MKGILKQSIAWLLMAVMIVSIVPATSVSAKNKGNVKGIVVKNVKNKKLELEPKQSFRLKVKVKKKGAVSEKVTYASSKKSVAMVNKSGKIKAVKEGKAVITIKSVANSKKKTRIKVVVRKKETDTTTQSTTQTSTTESTTDKKDEVTKPSEDKKNEEQKPSEDDKQDKPEKPEKPENPEKQDLSYEGYDLKWEDEFDGKELNRNDWNVETHEPGWVNAELQEYVDSPKNIYLEDGNLVIKPIKTGDGENATYTSGRINTQGKHDFTYGLFETRVKVPTGKGYLPAFWMMPTNENLYGQWPRCGEIDIMEVMGDNTKKAYGTIHYGNPHGQAQGTKVITEGDFSSQYHTYAVEWEPGKIVWYVDGIKYHEAKDWYSTTEGQGTVAYPAPFDQPFYMILNLAIGGSWVGYPDETTTYDDQAFTVDYVKAYQKSPEYYAEKEAKVEKPVKPEVEEPAKGENYLTNNDFSKEDDLSGENGSKWQFMTDKGGKATAAIVEAPAFGEGAKAVQIKTTAAGEESYAVQFVQANIPVKKGGKYQISFDAYAASDRKMIVDVSAPDYNYARYLNDTEVALTTTKQTYTYTFEVTDHDDANARLEFNLGNTDPISDVFITNVNFTRIGDVVIDDSKKVLTDGNYVYNGKFQEGTEAGKKNLQYWDIIDAGSKANYGVTGVPDNRRFKITTTGCEAANEVVLKQTQLPLTPGKYALSFDACLDTENAEETKDITVKVAGATDTFKIGKKSQSYTLKLTIGAEANIESIDDIEFALGVNGTVLLDNIRLVEDTLIKNGSFNAGLAGYEVYAYTPSNVTYVVDSQKENNAFDITIKNTGDQDWHIQLKQSDVVLEKEQWYNLKFKIKTDLAGGRKVSYAIQRNGEVHKNEADEKDWTPYVQDTVDVNGEYQTISVNFKMKYDTDTGSIFNIAMGKVDKQITTQHRICIDDISLEKIEEPEDVFPDIPAGTNLVQEADFAKGVGKDSAWVETIANGSNDWVADASSAIANGAITYKINNTGTKDWHVQLKQNDIPLQAGKTYVLSYDVQSSMNRKMHYAVQKNGENSGDWAAYKEADVNLTSESQHVKVEFTMPENDKYAVLSFSLGKIGEEEGAQITEEHTVTLSNISLVEKTSAGTETTNIIANGNFADGTTSWNPYIHSEELGSISVADGKITYIVNNPGTEEWNVKLTQERLTLEAGKKYHFTFKVTSSTNRTIKYVFQDPTDNKYTWYGGESLELEAGVEKVVNYTVDLTDKDTCNAIQMNVNMGVIDTYTSEGKTTYTPTEAAVITLSDFVLTEITE